ncbi:MULTISPECIES: flagellar assembly peptidoglycan hydrolase FlgJ [unclassified Thioalkalivibrio]|uniref:flagellar assembly peptidoglycan hydrolase FlgJ n=1 Tax=unclassified Thioalkalivibrio TaxID=2621013 RepID=UPI000475EC83|nr:MULTISPECIES: flagellar assembly peptidoglycan hydrolase FlgJ [unclassified Thioalkalivibrio]
MIGPSGESRMQAQSAMASDPSGLHELSRAARGGGREGMEAVAREFEAMLVGQMLKQMREASLGDGIFENEQTEMYQEMFDQEVARSVSQGEGLGLREALIRDMERNAPTDPEVLHDPERQQNLEAPRRNESLTPMRPREDGERPAAPANAANAVDGAGPGATAEQAGAGDVPRSMPEAAGGPRVDWPPRNPDEFLEKLGPAAERAAAELGVDASVLLAQSALETGWGQHVPSRTDGEPSFNLFGIKADRSWSGESVSVGTLEYRDGVAQREQARFRAYDDPERSFADYVDFIRSNPRYERALQAGDDATYVRELQAAGYATDPRYAEKILDLRDRVAQAREPVHAQVSAGAADNPVEG